MRPWVNEASKVLDEQVKLYSGGGPEMIEDARKVEVRSDPIRSDPIRACVWLFLFFFFQLDAETDPQSDMRAEHEHTRLDLIRYDTIGPLLAVAALRCWVRTMGCTGNEPVACHVN